MKQKNNLAAFLGGLTGLCLVLSAPGQPCQAESITPEKPGVTVEKTASQTTSFHVEGMFCASCANHVRDALKKQDGIQSVIIKTKENLAVISFDPKKVTAQSIIKTIEGAGFSAKL